MALDGGFGDAEFSGNLFVAVAADEKFKNLKFPRTQIGIGHARCQSASRRRRQETPAGMDPLQGFDRGSILLFQITPIPAKSGWPSTADHF